MDRETRLELLRDAFADADQLTAEALRAAGWERAEEQAGLPELGNGSR